MMIIFVLQRPLSTISAGTTTILETICKNYTRRNDDHNAAAYHKNSLSHHTRTGW